MSNHYIYKIVKVSELLDISKETAETIRNMQREGWEYVPEGICATERYKVRVFLTFRKPR